MKFSVQFDGLEEVVVTHMEGGKRFTPTRRFKDLRLACKELRIRHKEYKEEFVTNNLSSTITTILTNHFNEYKEDDGRLDECIADLCDDSDAGGLSEEIRNTLLMKVAYITQLGDTLKMLLMVGVEKGVLVTVKFSDAWETFDISLQEGTFCLSAPQRK